MQELTYEMSFERLRKLGRRAGRKAYPDLWIKRWLFLGGFIIILIVISSFGDDVEVWFARKGIPGGGFIPLVGMIGIAVIGVIWLRKAAMQRLKSRVDFNQSIHLIRDEGGVRISTRDIEYYLKWPGISQMLMEPDGVVISHGNLFFLVPDKAFPNENERLEFIRSVYSSLSEKAQRLSQPHIAEFLA